MSNPTPIVMAEPSRAGLPALAWLSGTYGPYAFGLVSILLIWFAVVRPELASFRATTEVITSQYAAAAERTAVALTVSAERASAIGAAVDRLAVSIDRIKGP